MNQGSLFEYQYEDLSAQPNKSPNLNPQYPPYDMNRMYPNFPDQMDSSDFLKRRKFSLADMISVIKQDPNQQNDHNQIGFTNLYGPNLNNFDQLLQYQQSPQMMPQNFPIPQNFSLNPNMPPLDPTNVPSFMLNQPEIQVKSENKNQTGPAVDINGTQININLAAAILDQDQPLPKVKKQRKTKAEKLLQQQLQQSQEGGETGGSPAPKKKKSKKQKELENATNTNNNQPQDEFQSSNSTDVSQDKEKKQKTDKNKDNNTQNSNQNNQIQQNLQQKKGSGIEEGGLFQSLVKIENEEENQNMQNGINLKSSENINEQGQEEDLNDPNNENSKKNGNKRIYIKRTTEKVRRWTKEESLLYEKFIEMYLDIMRDSSSKRNKKIFLLMSKFIGTKTPSQCRSHHQKFFKKIIKALTKDPNAEPKPLAELPDIQGALDELEKGKKKRQNKKKNKENEGGEGIKLEDGQIKIEPNLDEQNLMNNIAPLSAFNMNQQFMGNLGQNMFQNQYGLQPGMGGMGMLGQPGYEGLMGMPQGQFQLQDQFQYPFVQQQNAFQNQLQAVQQAVRKRSYSFVNIKDHMGQEDTDDFDWKVMQKHQDSINWSKMFQNYQNINNNNSVDDYLKNLMAAHLDYFPVPGQFQHPAHDTSHGM